VPKSDHEFKRLVIHAETGKFLKADGSWTTNEAEAMNFNDITSVILACSRHRVRNAQVLLRFTTSGRFDVRLPLRSTAP
jgi:hypothetical protein